MGSALQKPHQEINENEYYKKLFIDNPGWNSREPNEDEQSRWAVIEEMVKKFGGAEEILDVGCGRGWLSKKLSSYGAVTGIEPVESVIIYAKSLFPEISFFATDPSEYLKSKPEKYTLIVCSEVLEHVVQKKEFVINLNRLTSLGGGLIITTPRAELKQLWESKYEKPAQPIEEWISTTDLINLLNECGYKVLLSETAFAESIYQIHFAKKIQEI